MNYDCCVMKMYNSECQFERANPLLYLLLVLTFDGQCLGLIWQRDRIRSDTRGTWFESSHWSNFIMNFLLLTVKKRPGMAHSI